MHPEHLVLFELIRLGLSPDSQFELKGLESPSVDWIAVVKMAFQQKVYAVAFDGLQAMYGRIQADASLLKKYPSVEAVYSKEYKKLKMNWMSKIVADTEYHEKQMNAIAQLSRLWKSHDIDAILLKGMAYAQYYPNPSHRLSTDIDTFVRKQWELSNDLVAAEGVEVDADYYKNSTFVYQEALVENHQFCTPVRGEKRRKQYEAYLRSLLDGAQLEVVKGTEMKCPPALFNALYFMSHAQQHFLVEGGILLRHVCDWAMLLRAYASQIDWQEFDRQCHRFGFDHFAWAMTYVAHRIAGVSVPYDCPKVAKEINALIAEIMHPKHKPVDYEKGGWSVKMQVIVSLFHSRWKYKMFSDQSMLTVMYHTIAAYLFERKPGLEPPSVPPIGG